MPGVPRSRAAVAAVAVAVSCVAAGVRGGEVRLERRADRIDVSIDGRPFTSYVFRGHRKPILFPVHGPGGESLTRSWPIVAGSRCVAATIRTWTWMSERPPTRSI